MVKALPFLLRPAWPDEARGIIQKPLINQAARIAPPNGVVLNVGAGEGLFSKWIESFAAVREIVNLDVHESNVRSADQRNRSVIASVTDIPLPDDSVDWVLCTEVIEHVKDDYRAVCELTRVLKPGAAVLITVPTPPAPHSPHHVREGYTLGQMWNLLRNAGLEIGYYDRCMRLFSRLRRVVWFGQYRVFGRNLMPRLVLRAFAYADRWVTIGRPYDLVVLARKP